MEGEFKELRHAIRVQQRQLVRIRPFDPQFPPEYCTTFNLSEEGLYFATSAGHYVPGMNIYVTSDFQPGKPDESFGVGHGGSRGGVGERSDGVAIRIFSPRQ